MDDVARLYEGFSAATAAGIEPRRRSPITWRGSRGKTRTRPSATGARELGDYRGVPAIAGARRARDGTAPEVRPRGARAAADRRSPPPARAGARAGDAQHRRARRVGGRARRRAREPTTWSSARSCPAARHPCRGSRTMVGFCINTVPVARAAPPDRPSRRLASAISRPGSCQQREFQHCALTTVHGWSGTPRGRPLFESIFIFENHASATGAGAAWRRAFERTSYPLTVIVGVAGGAVGAHPLRRRGDRRGGGRASRQRLTAGTRPRSPRLRRTPIAGASADERRGAASGLLARGRRRAPGARAGVHELFAWRAEAPAADGARGRRRAPRDFRRAVRAAGMLAAGRRRRGAAGAGGSWRSPSTARSRR